MKTLLINTLLVISLFASAPLLAQDQPLRVGMSGQYFPFTFVEQDELKGFEVDVMNALGKEMGRDIQYETANFSGLFGMLQSGRIDTVANQITNAYPFHDTEAGRALRDEVNKALATLRDNGTLASISEKWFGTDITQP